jgi:hypothetical protein
MIPGEKYGLWTVVCESPESTAKARKWTCKCRCGLIQEVWVTNIVAGTTRGCRSCRSRDAHAADRLLRARGGTPARNAVPATPSEPTLLDDDLCRILTDWATRPAAGQDDL